MQRVFIMYKFIYKQYVYILLNHTYDYTKKYGGNIDDS
jgi:hypothetical protein